MLPTSRFWAAAVLTVDFSLDGYNIIPDILSAVCLVAGLLIIKKYIKNWKFATLSAVMYGVISLASIVLEYIFASKYYIYAIDIDPETYNFFIIVCAGCALSAVLFVVSIITLTKFILHDTIDKYTGFSMTTNDTYNPSEKVKRLHTELKRRTLILIALAALSAIISVAVKLLIVAVGFLWMVSIVVDVVYAVFTFKVLNEIRDQIEYKYMLS